MRAMLAKDDLRIAKVVFGSGNVYRTAQLNLSEALQVNLSDVRNAPFRKFRLGRQSPRGLVKSEYEIGSGAEREMTVVFSG